MFKGVKMNDNPLSFIIPASKHVKFKKDHKIGLSMHHNGFCKTTQKPKGQCTLCTSNFNQKLSQPIPRSQ